LLHEERYWLTFDPRAPLPSHPDVYAETCFVGRTQYRLSRLQHWINLLTEPTTPPSMTASSSGTTQSSSSSASSQAAPLAVSSSAPSRATQSMPYTTAL